MRGSFGQALKAARMSKGLTLREFCLKNGLSPGNMSRYERGVWWPPVNPFKILKWLRLMGYKTREHVVENALRTAAGELAGRVWSTFMPAIRRSRT